MKTYLDYLQIILTYKNNILSQDQMLIKYNKLYWNKSKNIRFYVDVN
jgi:hypothetical protein